MVQRLHYRRQNHYKTKSNVVRRVKTPGGDLTFQNVKKFYGRQKCGDCKKPLPGLPRKGPGEYRRLKKRQRTINRPYGGSRCHRCVREKIIRAFLLEEQRRVKLVLMEKEKQKREDNSNNNNNFKGSNSATAGKGDKKKKSSGTNTGKRKDKK